MKALSGRAFARLVEGRGWTLLRINGSHHIYGKPGSVVLKIGLLRHLAKLAELSEDELS